MTRKLIAMVLAAGAMLGAWGDTWTDLDTGYTWTYRIVNGGAEIYKADWSPAISPSPTGAVTIPSYLGGKSVTRIGDYAFASCYDLTSVAMPDSVTSIGGFAFAYCSALTSMTIPNSVTSIGGDVFQYCSDFLFDTETIPGVKLVDGWAIGHTGSLSGDLNLMGVRGIGVGAFAYCRGLTSVTISESVTSIGSYAFSGCSGLMSFAVDNGNANYKLVDGLLLSKDGKTLVAVPGGLTSVTIPNSVTSIGPCVFYECGGLTNVTIPDSVTSIGDYAFHNCSRLTSVTIPSSVTSIGDYAFHNCSRLTSVTIPDGVACIGDGVFAWCERLMSVTIPDSVTSIGYETFENCYSLTSVTIPNSVTSIGDWAFSGCEGLTCVTIPDGVTSIGDYAFHNCGGLTNVAIGTGVTNIGDYAFASCSGLASVMIPNGATSIGDWTFAGCSGLTSVTIPGSVTSIGDYAFYKCSGLTNVTIPDSVTSIGNYAFHSCSGLTSVAISDSVTSIGSSAFSGCSTLLFDTTTILGVTLVDGWAVGYTDSLSDRLDLTGIRGIGDYAFSHCYGLTSVTIPDSVTSIGSSAFYFCSGLTDVTIPDSVTSIGDHAFYWCHGLTSVTISDGVTSVGSSAFIDCYGLTSVTIPNSVTNIGDYAFQYCRGLTNIAIGNSVTSIGAVAFRGCSNLHKAFLPDTLKGRVAASVFESCADDFEIEYYQTTPRYKMIVGDKVEFDVGLVGCKVTDLPSGLKYDAKRGVVSGMAKKAGEYEATFTKKGEDDVTVMFSVREEEVSVGCEGLSGGTFTAGVAGNADGIPLEIESETGVKSVAVAKLPAGMKYDTKTGFITGAPTKPGDYAVAVTVTTKSGAKRTETIAISVAALPDTVVGVFNGFVKTADGEENLGTIQLTTTDTGKLTAKVTTAAGSYSFGGTCWDKVEGDIYSATLVTKKGETLTLALDSTAGWNESQLTGSFAAAAGQSPYPVVARKNAFGKTWYFNAAGNERDGWRLSYAENAKAAALTVTLNADGSTKIAGKLGTLSVSASGYADVTRLSEGVIIADFAPVVSVKAGKATLKRVLSIGTNLWFDRSNAHPYIGSVYLQ